MVRVIAMAFGGGNDSHAICSLREHECDDALGVNHCDVGHGHPTCAQMKALKAAPPPRAFNHLLRHHV